jgi:hypothetical protein
MKICVMHIFIDLVAVACSERLRLRTPLSDSCLETAGSGGIWSSAPIFFLWPFGFRRSASKLYWLLISWRMFSFHGAGRECHDIQDPRTRKRWSESRWWLGIGSAIRDLQQRYASGGDYIGGVHSLTFQGENPRSGLNWLCLAIV